jgi:multisubunit Na+/H+ antiporter MnhC subunit
MTNPEDNGKVVMQDGERLPYPVIDPTTVQAVSAGIGATGVALLSSTTGGGQAALELGRTAISQAALLAGFPSLPGSLKAGIVLTALSVGLNFVSLLLRYLYRSAYEKESVQTSRG